MSSQGQLVGGHWAGHFGSGPGAEPTRARQPEVAPHTLVAHFPSEPQVLLVPAPLWGRGSQLTSVSPFDAGTRPVQRPSDRPTHSDLTQFHSGFRPECWLLPHSLPQRKHPALFPLSAPIPWLPFFSSKCVPALPGMLLPNTLQGWLAPSQSSGPGSTVDSSKCPVLEECPI